MATADQYANWIVQNQDRKGSPEFETVAAAYKEAKGQIATARPQPVQEEAPNPTEGNSFLENARIGLGKSFVDTVEGVKQLVSSGADSLADASASVAQKNPNMEFLGTGMGENVYTDAAARFKQDTSANVSNVQAQIDERARIDEPIMNTGGGMLGNIAGQAVQVAAPASLVGKAGAVTRLANPLSKYAIAGAEGAAFAGAQPVVTGGSRGQNAAIGAAGGVVGQGVAAGVGKIAAPSASVSDDVARLANRAKELEIPVRADQVVNSKPLNVVSSALDYVPFSGSAGAKESQQKAFNKAVSRTIGENTDNLAGALKAAESRLGNEFDNVLKNTSVRADDDFIADLAQVAEDAKIEMKDDQLKVFNKQIENILGKVQQGDVIDASAAYNIKKGLDRIVNGGDSTLAHYAKEIRSALFDALNRSLPDGGEAFAKTRQQYGNMRELEKLIPRGAEVDISPARLANARNIRSKDLGELADISAQFLKGRVGDSGTAQRAGVYGMLGAGTMVDPVSAGIGLTLGRVANTAMGSNRLANYMVNGVPALQNSQVPNRLLPAVGTSLAIGNQ